MLHEENFNKKKNILTLAWQRCFIVILPTSKLVLTTVLKSFPAGSDGKESACNAGDPSLIPGSGGSPGEGNGNRLSILAWRIPWTDEPGGLYSPWGRKASDTTEQLTLLLLLF